MVGLIFYVLGAVGNFLPLLLWGFIESTLEEPPFNVDMNFTTSFFPLVFPFGIGFALTAGFSFWTWVTWDNINKGKYVAARTACLVLGIFGLGLAWLIGGIFLLMAYGKLGDVLREPQVTPTPTQPAGRICTQCGRPIAWDAKFCEHCGKELG